MLEATYAGSGESKGCWELASLHPSNAASDEVAARFVSRCDEHIDVGSVFGSGFSAQHVRERSLTIAGEKLVQPYRFLVEGDVGGGAMKGAKAIRAYALSLNFAEAKGSIKSRRLGREKRCHPRTKEGKILLEGAKGERSQSLQRGHRFARTIL